MINLDDKNKVISISDPELFRENPELMLLIIEKAAITGYRFNGITWDGLFINSKLLETLSKHRIREILDSIYNCGNFHYALELLINSTLHKRIIDSDYIRIEDSKIKNIAIDDVETIGDFYYFLSLGDVDIFVNVFGKDKRIIDYIEALNMVFDACSENTSLRFNYSLSVALLKEAKVKSKKITDSGLLYPEIKTTIKLFEI